MSLDDLFDRLAERAVHLSLEGDRLCFRAPKGALSADLRHAIVDHREAVIARLQRRASLGTATGHCSVCDRRNWVDESPKDGRIRTVCGVCGRFIGYRPSPAIGQKVT